MIRQRDVIAAKKAGQKQFCKAFIGGLAGLLIIANLIMNIIALNIATGTNTGHGISSSSYKSLIESEASYAVVIPPQASRVSHNIYYLGDRQKNEQILSGFIVMHRADSSRVFSLRDDEFNNYTLAYGSGQQKCWGVYGTGAKWKNLETYLINTRNRQNLSPEFIIGTFEAAVAVWNTQYSIFGSRTSSEGVRTNGASLDEPDGHNEVRFGSIAEPGVIALTIVWGNFDGSISKREIVEWDMIFDDADFQWGDGDVDGDVMDFMNIAVHELGHALGLTDQYSHACSEATMFGYSTVGETKKRTLDMADRMGACNLYGTCQSSSVLSQEEQEETTTPPVSIIESQSVTSSATSRSIRKYIL